MTSDGLTVTHIAYMQPRTNVAVLIKHIANAMNKKVSVLNEYLGKDYFSSDVLKKLAPSNLAKNVKRDSIPMLTSLAGNNDLSIWNIVALEILFNLALRSQFEKDTLTTSLYHSSL